MDGPQARDARENIQKPVGGSYQLFPQLQQQAQLFGAGQFGETQMTGLEARLIAEQARANLLGSIGSGILGGLFTPVATKGGGVGSLLSDLLTGG